MSVDDLSSTLEDSLLDSSLGLDPEKKEHPRFSHLYKNAGRKVEDQEVRRQRILQRQKESRQEFQALARSLVTEGDEEFEELEVEAMDEVQVSVSLEPSSSSLSNNPFSHRSWRRRPYKDILMLSEWLVDIPMDFHENWLGVPCPVGKRNLVVAGRGKTQYYSRSGVYLGSFPSNLPQGRRVQRGDSGSSPWKKGSLTLLDCVYANEAFYVLDVILWDGMPFNECSTELRSFWTKSKLSELAAGQKSRLNPHPFIPLPFFPCGDLQTLFEMPLAQHFQGEGIDLDGMLFYHREAFYHPGQSPLVGWLKGYMVAEMMPELHVLSEYASDRPLGYSTMKTYIDEYQGKKTEEQKKKIFTFQKETPSPKQPSEREEKLRSILSETLSVQKAMEF